MVRRTFLIVALFLISACGGVDDLPFIGGGGGGGGPEAGDPAKVSLKVSPQSIDTGDFVEVEVRITDVTEPFTIKFRHDPKLAYVEGSMSLLGDGRSSPNVPSPTGFGVLVELEEEEEEEVEDEEETEDGTEEGTEGDSEEEEANEVSEESTEPEVVEVRFLAIPFYNPDHFGKDGRGTLTFLFQGKGPHDSWVEIDPDHFENIKNPVPFDLKSPRFSSVAKVRVEVREDDLL